MNKQHDCAIIGQWLQFLTSNYNSDLRFGNTFGSFHTENFQYSMFFVSRYWFQVGSIDISETAARIFCEGCSSVCLPAATTVCIPTWNGQRSSDDFSFKIPD